MPTISSILNAAASGLRTQQAALDVTSHNIANSSTEGYSRQRAVITTNVPLYTREGQYGTGSHVADVTQARDRLLDANYRRESSDTSQYQTRSDMLSRVETVLNEPSDLGLANALDQFFNAWSDLAANPTSSSSRTVVLQRAQGLVDKVHEFSDNLSQIQQEAESRLTDGVSRLNALTDEVARLNRQIVSVETDGTTAADLRDERGRALDELATLVPVQVTERSDGSVGVAMVGVNIVDGAATTEVQTQDAGGTVGLKLAGHDTLITKTSGTVGGLLGVMNEDLPGYRAALDGFATALTEQVNGLHSGGTLSDGSAAGDFFSVGSSSGSGPTDSAAHALSLVVTSADDIAAGTSNMPGTYQPGANDVALRISQLRDAAPTDGEQTVTNRLQGLVSSVGLAVRSSADAAEVHQTLADQADTRRTSLSSVSIDEELVNMIQFQSGYQAAARVVTAADEMLKSLLAM